MAISLYRGDSQISSLDGADGKMLGYFGIQDYDVLQVDGNKANFQRIVDFDDLNKVEKYEMPEDEYEKRKDTVLDFKKQHHIGRFGDLKHAPLPSEESIQDIQKKIILNSRCQVKISDSGLLRRGSVRFLGNTEFASGLWVGIEYDEPLGKNNGSIDGVFYFKCPENYGSFVRPQFVECGDFPEELEISDLDEEL
ncbi:Tubulin-folding cofactor B [Smittium mucronatum]|uniref:Tubulin-folding cofactor B n=1 Tax=Smittium mucronatum TaxID=133383 RepID=A0A1R0GZD1_9FUNG|nr:Tubulin-folding cofactor B [Smittium mucronatum]